MSKVLVKRYAGCGKWVERVVEADEVVTSGPNADEVLGTDVTEEFEKVAEEAEVEVAAE